MQRTTWVRVEAGTEAQPMLVRWSTFLPPSPDGIGGAVYLAYALATPEGPVLVDPVWPATDSAERLQDLVRRMGGRPTASLLTNEMHERDAYAARDRWNIPVWAPAAGAGEYEGRPDYTYREGDPLPGGVRAISIEGPFPGDTCLHWRAADGTGILFTGDAVLGYRDEQDPRPFTGGAEPGLFLHGVGAHPRGVQDVGRFTASLRRLLDLEFDVVCAAHGRPYVGGAKAALALLLDAPR